MSMLLEPWTLEIYRILPLNGLGPEFLGWRENFMA